MLQVLMRILVYLLALCAGAVLITMAIAPTVITAPVGDFLIYAQGTAGRITTGGAGALFVLMPIGLSLRWYASRRYAREISYQTENGQVSVSLQAIEEALARAVEADEAVRKVSLKVYDDRVKRQIGILCTLNLWDDGDVTGINRRCQQQIRERFGELMPEQAAVNIHISVHRLTPRPAEVPMVDAEKVDTGEIAGEAKPAQRPLLPGLAATQGQIDNQAGAALLRRRKQSTDGLDSDVVEPEPEAETEAVTADPEADPPGSDIDFEAIDDEDEDPMANLYVGPQYTVEPDEDDDEQHR